MRKLQNEGFDFQFQSRFPKDVSVHWDNSAISKFLPVLGVKARERARSNRVKEALLYPVTVKSKSPREFFYRTLHMAPLYYSKLRASNKSDKKDWKVLIEALS